MSMSDRKVIFKSTADQTGRNWIITPENSDLECLGYARIILNDEEPEADYSNPDFESALICLAGQGEVSLNGDLHSMKPYDTLFVPPGHEGTIKTGGHFDLVECTAPSEQTGSAVFVPFADLNEDEELTQDLGFDGCHRKIHRLIDENVPAKRLLCGLIFSKDGNWTSWAPHEHAATKEEIYLYFEMPPPSFGIQLVYEDIEAPEYLCLLYTSPSPRD